MPTATTLARGLARLLATTAGGGAVLGLTHYLIPSQGLDQAHATKAWVIAGGIIAGGMLLPRLTGKAKALFVIGVVCAEAFNIGSVAEQTWRERANARADIVQANNVAADAYQKALSAHNVATARVATAETTLAAKEAARANDAPKRDCKRECMAGHLDAVTAARREVEEARKALSDAPHPGNHPVPLNPDAGGTDWRFDLAMGLIGAIGGNLIAIGLLSFGATSGPVQPAAPPAPAPVDFKPLVPRIIVADEPQSDIVSEFEAAKLRTMLSDPLPDKPGRTVAEVIAGRRSDGHGKPDKKPDMPKPPKGGLSKADALDDLMQRLADGRSIPSDQSLADDWNRPKQTVNDWMRGWRKIGIIPEPVQTGRCNVTMAKV